MLSWLCSEVDMKKVDMNYDNVLKKAQDIVDSLEEKFPSMTGAQAKSGIDFARRKMHEGDYSVEEFYAVQVAMMYKVEVTNYYKH